MGIIIKVHGVPRSGATAKVLACLHEKELEYELVPVNLSAGEHKKEPYLSLHPFGEVPVYEDGELKLIESRAIISYIAYTYAHKGTNLAPLDDPKKMATMAVWIEVEAQKFHPIAAKLCYALDVKTIKPFLGIAKGVEISAKEEEEKLSKVLDVYEARLSKSDYLCGESFTLADLNHLPFLHYLMGTKAKALFDARPHVSSWCARILARPSWIKVVQMQKAQRKLFQSRL